MKITTILVALGALDVTPPSVNVLAQAGHASLRAVTMDTLDRPASDAEICGWLSQEPSRVAPRRTLSIATRHANRAMLS